MLSVLSGRLGSRHRPGTSLALDLEPHVRCIEKTHDKAVREKTLNKMSKDSVNKDRNE